MKNQNFFVVKYNGKNSRYKNREWYVHAENEKQAIEMVFRNIMDWNFFPELPDGDYVCGDNYIIRDCDGMIIRDNNEIEISYDGGYFYAEKI